MALRDLGIVGAKVADPLVVNFATACFDQAVYRALDEKITEMKG
jgi:hypothetical protein